MKTPMQDLFLVIKNLNKDLYDTMYNEGIIGTALEKEKEHIIDAVDYGAERFGEVGEDYYKYKYSPPVWDYPPFILDFDKVKEEWLEETKGMTEFEKVLYLINKNK